MDDDTALFGGLLLATVIGIVVGLLFSSFVLDGQVKLYQETADDICQQLMGDNRTYEAHAENGKLVCEAPSFDNTQNIIFRDNGGGG